MALTAVISFAIFTGIGAILLFAETVAFFGGLSGGNTRTASPLYAGNQSLLGVFFRLGDSSRVTTLVGLGVAGIVALLGCLVAAYWWRAGEKVFAVALVGLCTCLASPLSWTHHYVWILPMGAAVVLSRGLPRWARVVAGFWVVWVSRLPPAGHPALRRRPRTLLHRAAATDRQPRPDPRRDPGRRPGLAIGHPLPRRRRSQPSSQLNLGLRRVV